MPYGQNTQQELAKCLKESKEAIVSLVQLNQWLGGGCTVMPLFRRTWVLIELRDKYRLQAKKAFATHEETIGYEQQYFYSRHLSYANAMLDIERVLSAIA